MTHYKGVKHIRWDAFHIDFLKTLAKEVKRGYLKVSFNKIHIWKNILYFNPNESLITVDKRIRLLDQKT